jgi:Hsp70 protein
MRTRQQHHIPVSISLTTPSIIFFLYICIYTGSDPRYDPLQLRRLLESAEAARIRLSNEREVPIVVPYLDGVTGLDTTLTRKKMETLCREPLHRLLQVSSNHYLSDKLHTFQFKTLLLQPQTVAVVLKHCDIAMDVST